jgi:hypothetical protein
MIAVKLMGGLGNQMFQYAIARACTNNVHLDLSFFRNHSGPTETFTSRNFSLNIFPNISYQEMSVLNRFLYLKEFRIPLVRRIIKLLGGNCHVIRQFENEYISFKREKNLYFDGYFQSEKYFAPIRDILLHDFEFPNLDVENSKWEKQILNDPNAVSVHIRRGDYLKPAVLEYHGLIPERFYIEAMNKIRAMHPNATWYVFSDDLPNAKQLFKPIDCCFFIEGNNQQEWKDMALMAACRHHIIANSSFSWWGAWLSKHSGITIAPKNWFNPAKAKFDIHDIIPAHWHISSWDE